MTFNTKHLYAITGILAVALIAGMVAHAYVSSLLNVARANQVREDMKPVHEEAQTQKQEAQKSEALNQKDLALILAAITAQKQQPVQPVDYDKIDAMIALRMNGAKAETKPNPELPDAPSTTLPTQSLRDYMLDCDAKGETLKSCIVTVENKQKELEAEQKDHAATKKELEATRKAMKGGGFWSRLKGNAKWFAIGGAIGAGAVAVAKH